MANFRQGIYTVKNPGKYVGKGAPRYRSGWELTFMMFLDSNDNIMQWASESITIPYQEDYSWDGNIYYGASLLALNNLANKKNYSLVRKLNYCTLMQF